jgi:hypothetical protein
LSALTGAAGAFLTRVLATGFLAGAGGAVFLDFTDEDLVADGLVELGLEALGGGGAFCGVLVAALGAGFAALEAALAGFGAGFDVGAELPLDAGFAAVFALVLFAGLAIDQLRVR